MKKQRELDAYLLKLLGNKCKFGYHTQPVEIRTVSTLGKKIHTAVVPESSRKMEAV